MHVNPCPCGYYGDGSGRCTCTPGMISRYMSKISGPLMDRVDLSIKVMPVDKDLLVDGVKGEESKIIAQRVQRAREIQYKRFRSVGIYTNSQMNSEHLSKFCELGVEEKEFVNSIMEAFSLSARGYSRILRISRTIADMDGADKIKVRHISEAVQYRFQRDFL